ncbi:HU family DNA-binding protein [Odoribacter laneus]|uniref:DNA-binding protein HU n=1 Tax=Odoribacter laneus YIT 12061 TaxID=742817 RepID=H1DD59_9BACT|nr:HU family DNA-binding protein [Odoribacter laneus]EHP51035.1 hypothetical protein HMPREF9449_00037 [Odoribacter laneus YIT 12061]
MNKKELCNALAERTGLSKTESQKAFNAVIEIITNEMKQNGRITLIGFGSFSVKQKAARKGMNPTSFAPIDIPAKKVVNFKPSIYLNHLLNVKKRGRKRKDENNISL